MPFLDFGTRFSRDICLYRLCELKGSVERTLPPAARGICPLVVNKIFVSRGSMDLSGITLETKQHHGPEQSASCRRSAAALTMRSVTHYFRQRVVNRPLGVAGPQREPNTNRRKQMRYPLRASVVYRWRDTAGMRRCGRGWTQDVSEEGVLVCSEDCPAVGELLDLVLRVPTLRKPVPAPPLRMDMKAKVIRILNDTGERKNLGFAARRRDGAGAKEGKSERPTLPYQAFAVGPRAN
jgi:hypothetical protein